MILEISIKIISYSIGARKANERRSRGVDSVNSRLKFLVSIPYLYAPLEL